MKKAETENKQKKATPKDDVVKDNSITLHFVANKLSEKELKDIEKTWDKIKNEHSKSISEYYVKTSENTTNTRGTKKSGGFEYDSYIF